MNTKITYSVLVAIFISSCSIINPNKTELRNEAIEFARMYSGTISERNWSDGYWDTIGIFIDSKEFNRTMELIFMPENKYSDSLDQWNWINDSLMHIYREKRNTAKLKT